MYGLFKEVLVDKMILPCGRETVLDWKDNRDLSELGLRWRSLEVNGGKIYVVADNKALRVDAPKLVFMHRLLMGVQWSGRKAVVDHINNDGLDNRRRNLRMCTSSLNMARAPRKTTGVRTASFRGVSRKRERFRAGIMVDGHQKHLGMFGTEEEAARAYDQAAMEAFGEFALLNFPVESVA